MDKSSRQAFLELERMIIKSKIETLAAIPPNQSYNDTEIKKKIESIESKMERIEQKYNEQISLIREYGVWQQNNRATLDNIISMNDGFAMFSDMLVILYQTLSDTPYIIALKKSKAWRERLEEWNDWMITRNKLYEKTNATAKEYRIMRMDDDE